ncbi:MAG: pyruvate dehydrogenase complex dihydrolipoamide acetyltransferase [Sphingobacteriales bacterium]|nr:MAG: pyruvate dehydrogenase complex dihydrolipoamide acetyltransferase [Sphingobacteriales bacterium]
MAEVIRMPLLSDTMKEGVIATWHKKVGDAVKADDAIADVETDKATMEVMPYVDGTLLYVSPEKAIPVNGILAIVGKSGESYQELLDNESKAVPETAPAETGKPESKEATDVAEVKNPANEVKASPAGKQENTTGEIPNGNVSNENAVNIEGALPKDVTVVRMPLLSDTMKEGKIVAWHKKEGDSVKGDDVLADVETDKATMEVMGYADGTLLHIGVPEGEAAQINAIIAIIGPKGTDISAILNAPAAPQPATEDRPETTQSTAPEAKQPEQKQPEASKATPAAAETAASEDSGDRVKISPLARRLAEDKGIDIHALKGSGDGGRIIKRDVDSYQPAATSQAPAAQQPAVSPNASATQQASEEGYTDVPNSTMRTRIAERLSESKFTAPHFYLTISVTMDGAMAAREQWNKLSPVKISFNDLTIKAAAMALRQHPDVNASWLGDKIRRYNYINIGTAVATEGGGLIVPVVRGADKKSLSEIAATTKELIGKVRDKKIQPADYSGNTFSISNLGMMDIDEFTAIINPPDACILAVGRIAETPVVEQGQILIRNVMKLTLSCDHRAVDGAVGARFLQSLKGFLENPVTMLV